jgi:NAD(P)H dehydrogenase (quinone)
MIAVLGATGTIGTHVAAGIAAAGEPARALVRDPDGADCTLPTVAADLRKPATFRAALSGADQLFLVTPHGPDQDLLEAAAVDAAAASGVQRIVKVSGGAATLGPNGTTSTAVAHWRSERRIEASGLAFSFLRPSFVMQNLLTMRPKAGFLPLPMGHAKLAMIDARDVADCAVAALRDRHAPDMAWQLTGPAGVTFGDAARRLGARYVNVPVRIAGATLRRRGAAPFEVEHALRMAAYFASGADGTATDAVERLTGRPPRTLDTFLSEHHAAKGS